MFTLILFLLILLPVTLLPLALSTLFSASDLNEMGICLEGAEAVSDGSFVEDVVATTMCVACMNP